MADEAEAGPGAPHAAGAGSPAPPHASPSEPLRGLIRPIPGPHMARSFSSSSDSELSDAGSGSGASSQAGSRTGSGASLGPGSAPGEHTSPQERPNTSRPVKHVRTPSTDSAFDVRTPSTDSTTGPKKRDAPRSQGQGGCWRRPSLRPLGRAVDRLLLAVFGFIARAVAARPVLTLVLTICAGLGMASGIIFLKPLDDFNALYIPHNTQTATDMERVYMVYPRQPQVVRILLVSKPGGQQNAAGNSSSGSGSSSGANLLTKPVLLAFMDIFHDLYALNRGTNYSLRAPKVCHRPQVAPHSPCDMASVLDFWHHNRAALEADADVLETINRGGAYNDMGDPIVTKEVMGGVQRDPGSGAILGAAALQLTLWLQISQEADAWQQGAVPLVRALRPQQPIEVYIYSTWQYNKTALDERYGDLPLALCGFFLILVYGVMLLFRPHPVYSRVSLTFANIASILLTVASTVGVCSYAGLGFSLVGQVLPLLLLGLGTDDMLVTLAAEEEVAREAPELGTREHVERAVTRARRCIVVATLTNLAVFCTGTSSSLPALQDFMLYSAVGVSLLLAFQSTFFVACLTLCHRRQQANRWDLLCCVTSRAAPTEGCFGRPYDAAPTAHTWTHQAVGRLLPRLILHPAGMGAVLAVTAALAVMGGLGVALVRSGFHPDFLIPAATYEGGVIAVRDQYFPSKGVSFVGVYATFPMPPAPGAAAPEETEGSLRGQLAQLQALADTFSPQTNSLVAPGTLRAWYPAFLQWVKELSPVAGLLFQNQIQQGQGLAQFPVLLCAFLRSPRGAQYWQDIVMVDAQGHPSVGCPLTGLFNASGLGSADQLAKEFLHATVQVSGNVSANASLHGSGNGPMQGGLGAPLAGGSLSLRVHGSARVSGIGPAGASATVTVDASVNAASSGRGHAAPKVSVNGSTRVSVNASGLGAPNLGSLRLPQNPGAWLVSARYTLFTVNLPDSNAQVAAMEAARSAAARAAPGLQGFVYGDDFFAFEGYAVAWRETMTALGIASGVVFVLMLLLLADLVASLLVGGAVALVNLELLGFIHWFGLTFNLVTALTLLLGLGIAIDYSAFIAYSFLTRKGTRKERAAKALDHLGEAVFKGGLTMFVAVVLVCFAHTYVFQTFFKMFSFMVLLGLWHALVALPVALALVGPRPYSSKAEEGPPELKEFADGKAIIDEEEYPFGPEKCSVIDRV